VPKRNIVWIAIGAVVAVLLWKVPEALIRRDSVYRKFGPLADVSLKIEKNYVEPVTDEVLLHGAIDGMLRQLDPYCEYFDEQEAEQFNERTEGQFYGIGIEVGESKSGEMVIVSPIEGGPAFQAGLQARDRITHIEGAKTADMTLQQGVDLIKKGEPGTSVTLTIHRPSTDEVFDKTIRRELVKIPSIRGWARSRNGEWDYLIDPEVSIGYVRILSFERTTGEQLNAVVRELLVEDGMRGLIIDVRANPGGLLDVVVKIVDRFVSEGKIVSTQGRHTSDQVWMATRENTYPERPLVVLVNHGSASASEILAGALQLLHRRATIVGEPTYGKGSVQELFPLESRKGMVKLTTGYYYLANDKPVHGHGVIPDEEVELTPAEQAELYKSQLAFYSVPDAPTTQPATGTAPAGGRTTIIIDPQLKKALGILRRQLAASPGNN